MRALVLQRSLQVSRSSVSPITCKTWECDISFSFHIVLLCVFKFGSRLADHLTKLSKNSRYQVAELFERALLVFSICGGFHSGRRICGWVIWTIDQHML